MSDCPQADLLRLWLGLLMFIHSCLRSDSYGFSPKKGLPMMISRQYEMPEEID